MTEEERRNFLAQTERLTADCADLISDTDFCRRVPEVVPFLTMLTILRARLEDGREP